MSFYIIWTSTFFISLIIEVFIKPLSPTYYRSYTTYLLHFSTISLFYILITLIVKRPIFSSLFIIITQFIFIIISNVKYKTLKEPLVFSDFVMFLQAFKYPRLYFPFLGWLPIIGIPFIIISSIILVIYFEKTISINYHLLVLFIFIFVFIIYIMALQQQPTINPVQDIYYIGFIASLVSYYILSKQKKHKKKIKNTLKNTDWYDTNNNKNFKDIIVIQSESFFDARRLHPSIAHHILNNFDKCCSEALQYGNLSVDAWGANTMRTEFSFLSSVSFEDMGYYRFYPYHYIRNYPVITLANYLQKIGYYCICIHPYHAGFFNRGTLFPQLGFDEFIDINDFSEADKYGPYISDKAVSKKIINALNKKNKPCFIFTITMENHGPLHLEKITSIDKEKYYVGKLPNNNETLSIYLRHLKNTDEMIGSLMLSLNNNNKNTLLCLYGDHIPSMPEIYNETDFNNNRTDYVIWSPLSAENNTNNRKNISIEDLAKSIKNRLRN